MKGEQAGGACAYACVIQWKENENTYDATLNDEESVVAFTCFSLDERAPLFPRASHSMVSTPAWAATSTDEPLASKVKHAWLDR